MNENDRPCFRCSERKVTVEYNCHSHCQKYKKWKLLYSKARGKAKKISFDWNGATRWY